MIVKLKESRDNEKIFTDAFVERDCRRFNFDDDHTPVKIEGCTRDVVSELDLGRTPDRKWMKKN
jgi:hypothetical protein